MRRDWIARSMPLGLALASVLAAGPADATPKKERVDRITCEEFLALDPANQQRIAYWVDGYQVAKGESAVSTIAFDKFDRPIGVVVDDCQATPKETLWQKVKKHF